MTVIGVPCPAVPTLYIENGRSVTHTMRKMIVKAARRMLSAISFGRLLAFCSFDQFDHAVQEASARFNRHGDDQPIGQDLGPAGDGASISAGFPDHQGRFLL